MEDALNVAVIGTGLFGQVHLQGYTEHPKAELKLICDVNAKALRKAARTYKVPAATADYRDVVNDPSIDAVSVATPDFLHREIVCALLKAGKHVLCEKPLATSLRDAAAMVKAAKAARRHLMVDFHNRFNPPFIEAKGRVGTPSFGEPLMAQAHMANPLSVPMKMLSWASKSGPQWFLFPHVIDLVCWLFDRRVERVTAVGRKGVLKAKGIDTYDTVQALLEFKDCSATVHTSWVLPNSTPIICLFGVSLFGTLGQMDITPIGHEISAAAPKQFVTPVVGALVDAHGEKTGWMYSPVNHFVNRLLDGAKPMVTPEEGFHNTAVICAIEKSIRTRKAADVEKL